MKRRGSTKEILVGGYDMNRTLHLLTSLLSDSQNWFLLGLGILLCGMSLHSTILVVVAVSIWLVIAAISVHRRIEEWWQHRTGRC